MYPRKYVAYESTFAVGNGASGKVAKHMCRISKVAKWLHIIYILKPHYIYPYRCAERGRRSARREKDTRNERNDLEKAASFFVERSAAYQTESFRNDRNSVFEA